MRLLSRLAALAFVAMTVYFVLPSVLTSLARQLMRTDPIAPGDVIVALGGDARCHREKKAAELYQQGVARRMIVSGVPSAWGVHTGDAAKRYLISLGIPADDIIVLHDSWNTRREAIDVAALMKSNGWHSGVIVTSPFHSRRALYTFERYAPGFTFVAAPLAPGSPEWQPERWWTRRGDMGITVRETISWANTIVGGLQ
ncbi:MAG: YdcF family protein [Acidobacteriota bacterium]